jgi:hypothetical protein
MRPGNIEFNNSSFETAALQPPQDEECLQTFQDF